MIANWIAVELDAPNLRAWIMDAENAPYAEVSSCTGVDGLLQAGFEVALLELVAPYLSDGRVTPVICSVTAGALGRAAQFVSTPCSPPDGGNAVSIDVNDPRVSVKILPGVKQISPLDVMQGQDAQIAGVLREYPNFDGIICLPGAHTKWVHISAGEIISFQTFMTGELLGLLSENSALRQGVEGDDWDQPIFLAAISDGMTRPQAVAANLFGIRAGSIVGDLPKGDARARLHGLLIGTELAAARPYWLGQNVAIVGAGPVTEMYRSALVEQGVPAAVLDTAGLMLAGLTAAYLSTEH